MPLYTAPPGADALSASVPIVLTGMNAAGRVETTPLAARLYDTYPAAWSAVRKACAAGKIAPGMLWLWRETRPMLGLLIVRETPVGAARPRFVEAAARAFVREYAAAGIGGAALAGLGADHEWDEHRRILERWWGGLPIPITLYPPGGG